MLAPTEFAILSTWCRTNALRGISTTSADGLPAFRLESDGPGTMCKQMMLFHREGQFHLIDDRGNALATSSSLQSVLDALGGGVALKDRRKDASWPGQNPNLSSFLFSV